MVLLYIWFFLYIYGDHSLLKSSEIFIFGGNHSFAFNRRSVVPLMSLLTEVSFPRGIPIPVVSTYVLTTIFIDMVIILNQLFTELWIFRNTKDFLTRNILSWLNLSKPFGSVGPQCSSISTFIWPVNLLDVSVTVRRVFCRQNRRLA